MSNATELANIGEKKSDDDDGSLLCFFPIPLSTPHTFSMFELWDGDYHDDWLYTTRRRVHSLLPLSFPLPLPTGWQLIRSLRTLLDGIRNWIGDFPVRTLRAIDSTCIFLPFSIEADFHLVSSGFHSGTRKANIRTRPPSCFTVRTWCVSLRDRRKNFTIRRHQKMLHIQLSKLTNFHESTIALQQNSLASIIYYFNDWDWSASFH